MPRTKHRDPNRGDCDRGALHWGQPARKLLLDETPRPEPRGLRRTRAGGSVARTARTRDETPRPEPRGLRRAPPGPPEARQHERRWGRNTETRTEGIATAAGLSIPRRED